MKLILLCICAFSATADYSDANARFKVYPMSAAVFTPTPQKCLESTFGDGKLQRRLEIICDDTKTDTCTVLTAYSVAEKTLVLSFRGTKGAEQLLIESEQTVLSPHIPWPSGGNVSKYFNDAFFRIWNGGVKDDVLSMVNKHPDFTFMVTGHSLGAALATLAASYLGILNIYPPSQIQLMTFGEPRVGDHKFAAGIDTLLPQAIRVTHYRDMICHVPIKNEEGYYHHKSEVYYAKDMGPGAPFVLCEQDESKQCSDQFKDDLNVIDHLIYYNVEVGEFGNNDCNYTMPVKKSSLRFRRN